MTTSKDMGNRRGACTGYGSTIFDSIDFRPGSTGNESIKRSHFPEVMADCYDMQDIAKETASTTRVHISDKLQMQKRNITNDKMEPQTANNST